MNTHDSTGHEEACKRAAPDDICTNCGAYELGLVRDICQQCKTRLFGRVLDPEEERSMAAASLARFQAENPRPIVDESVPRYGVQDRRLPMGWLLKSVFHGTDGRTTYLFSPWWSGANRIGIVFETRSRFPWIHISRY